MRIHKDWKTRTTASIFVCNWNTITRKTHLSLSVDYERALAYLSTTHMREHFLVVVAAVELLAVQLICRHCAGLIQSDRTYDHRAGEITQQRGKCSDDGGVCLVIVHLIFGQRFRFRTCGDQRSRWRRRVDSPRVRHCAKKDYCYIAFLYSFGIWLYETCVTWSQCIQCLHID